MNFDELIKTRKSIRSYLKEEVSDEDIKKMIRREIAENWRNE